MNQIGGNKKNIIGSLVLFMVTTFLLLLTLEISFRFFSPQIQEHDQLFQFDEILGWTFIPNKTSNIFYQGEANHSIQINKNGFRDSEIGIKKDKKILVLGDSFVSNIAVEDDQVFTEQLENKCKNTEVLNYGVNGYNTVQEFLLLKKLLKDQKPDLVIVVIYLRNDFTENIYSNWLLPSPLAKYNSLDSTATLIPPNPKNINAAITKKRLEHRSHLFAFAKRSSKNLKNKFLENKKFQPQELTYCNREHNETFSEAILVMQNLIQKIQILGEASEIPILFALAPSMFQVEDDQWELIIEYSDYSNTMDRTFSNQLLLKFAKDRHIEMVDLYPDLHKFSSFNKSNVYFPNEQHWNNEGNQVVANTLFHYLEENFSFK